MSWNLSWLSWKKTFNILMLDGERVHLRRISLKITLDIYVKETRKMLLAILLVAPMIQIFVSLTLHRYC